MSAGSGAFQQLDFAVLVIFRLKSFQFLNMINVTISVNQLKPNTLFLQGSNDLSLIIISKSEVEITVKRNVG